MHRRIGGRRRAQRDRGRGRAVALRRHRAATRPHGIAPAARPRDQSAGCRVGAGIDGGTRRIAPRTLRPQGRSISRGSPMKNILDSDAFVFFGATGDLAYKKIFPALYAMVHRSGLAIPIIGMARAGWSPDKLRGRARASVGKGGAFACGCVAKLAPPMRYVVAAFTGAATLPTLM